MRILAIDPGCEQSAWVRLIDGEPAEHGKCQNDSLLRKLYLDELHTDDRVAIEMIASYGMPVGREVFETVLWTGRFFEAWTHRQMTPPWLIYRRDVKLYHCESSRANDANIRAALIDRYGPGKERAIGTKKAPGPLYGIKADEWSALAIALTAAGKFHVERRDLDELFRIGRAAA